MRINVNVSIELRRPARRSVALIAAGLLLLTPAVVLADDRFWDVPPGGFHNQINAIAKAGITAGFNDGGYHPGEAVTRQAMAAFMERGFGRVGLVAGGTPITDSLTVVAGSREAGFVPLRQLTITVPGASNSFSPTQLVHVQGRVSLYTDMSAASGCPCEFQAMISDTTSGESFIQHQTFHTAAAEPFGHSFDVEALFAAPPGPRAYLLAVGLEWRANTSASAGFSTDRYTSLSAETFPFGPTGGSTVTAPGAQNEPANANQLPERRRDE